MGEEHKDAIDATTRKERTKMTKSARVARVNERATLTKTETERSTYRYFFPHVTKRKHQTN